MFVETVHPTSLQKPAKIGYLPLNSEKNQAGKHVLCEKPMATTVEECQRMMAEAESAKRKLMIAYRLHYEPMNLQVMQWCRDEKFGPVRSIASSNCQDVKAPNIRLSRDLGGGPLGDIGIYSLNATRYITGEEPIRATAIADAPNDDPRFAEVPANIGFTLEFPSGTIASCTCSFNGPEKRDFEVHCRDGVIAMDPAFSYRGLRLFTENTETRTQHKLAAINQFAAEMDHFALCIKNDTEPRTPGQEGLLDMRAMVAINRSVELGRTVEIAVQ
ncbi:Glucose--fructose oxidoreductase precursor [Allorhodopirellula solitaria]|uniref:Glucose--fructose oxidoreductase n=2 Tax=Allorhodopirellula solitaria TaxID=2527987 RepID=A0A5C5WN85_9BACT|nr:Glucose--fructose oxidoreductase precursor [Allorhodopirellula solitaria]